MTKPIDTEIPTSGGSYVRKPDGSLDQVHATEQPPAVQEREEAVPEAAPEPATYEEN